MAELKLTIGPLSSSVNASNAKAQVVLNNFLLNIGYTGAQTDQAKLDAIMAHLKAYLTDRARQYQARTQATTAEQTALVDAGNAFEA